MLHHETESKKARTHKKTFLFFPLEIRNTVKWLEFVKIKQYYYPAHYGQTGYWENMEFVD